MTLSAGARLGPYEILSPLGAGGMGEVYRARDTRLDRTVAIKVLPERVSSDPERRQRFEREARAVSSLNHPHICVLHDVGSQDGVDFIVMECLEGESLAERLTMGPLPLDQALRYGIEIADALDKAHRQGVVHRDLKPANIMLTKSGTKLLDFGLAKRFTHAGDSISGGSGLTHTQAKPLTGEGVFLGTLQYMAPEQLEGKEADARTDMFALGSVLYEMLTGSKAFEGKSSASLIAAILTSEPRPIASLQPLAPPGLERLVRTCLAKDPDERWQSAHDVVAELRWIGEGRGGAVVPATRLRAWERVGWIAACSVLLLTLAVLWRSPGPQTTDTRALRVSIFPPEGTLVESISLSPDGRLLALAGSGADGRTGLWIRPLDSDTAQLLSGTEGAQYPFWSPDGRALGFFAQGKLKKVDASGGHVEVLCDAAQPRGGAWSRDGVIAFSPSGGSALYRISSSGGKPEPVTRLAPSRLESSHRWPHFLPDGRHLLYVARSGRAEYGAIYAAPLDGGEPTRLLSAASNAVYAPPGYLVFERNGTLLALAFDARTLRPSNEPLPIAEGVGFDPGPFRAHFAVSDSGAVAYQTAASVTRYVAWFDRAGRQLSTVGSSENALNLALSPDDRRLAASQLSSRSGNRDIFVIDFSRGTSSRLTVDPATEFTPIWSPDASQIVFTSDRMGSRNLYRRPSAGGGEEELLLATDQAKNPNDWSPDGRFLVYDSSDPKTKFDLWVLAMGGERRASSLLRTAADERQAQFSPDGRWLAYASNESGRDEVYVQAFPSGSGRWIVSAAGGVLPRWRRDGKELYYVSLDRKVMAVGVKAGGSIEIDTPRELFQARGLDPFTSRSPYAVTADGQRFLISMLAPGAATSPISLVLNWTAGLKR